jgi:hypothetical protein
MRAIYLNDLVIGPKNITESTSSKRAKLENDW